jgi:hypothetical protein
MRGRLDARRTLKSLVADLRLAIFSGHNHQFRSATWKGIRVINVESPFNSIGKGEYMQIIIDRWNRMTIQHISY